VIPRYLPADVAALFSDAHRFDVMCEVEILVAEALAAAGQVPLADAHELRARRPVIDAAFVAEVEAREAITHHDTAAFVDVLQSHIDHPSAAWIHYGLTSSDVLDTAMCVIIRDALDVVIAQMRDLRAAVVSRALETIEWPLAGRTHGMHAEPTTFGIKFSHFARQFDRDIARLVRARTQIAVGKLSGAVGTYSNIEPEIEVAVCAALGLTAVPATQVIARDRHAEALYSLASAAASMEALALEIRHLARTEVGEVEEPFSAGQKGSSAMPHKRNPVISERICGLARVVRGYAHTALEDVALWHERDISHSSVERVIIPDAVALVTYMARKATTLISGLVIHRERALANVVEGSRGLVFSQSVLLALVDQGMDRDDAYRVVQALSTAVREQNSTLREVLASHEYGLTLNLDEVFSLERLVRHRQRFVADLHSLAS
jgi:adenylosuccinate lyase